MRGLLVRGRMAPCTRPSPDRVAAADRGPRSAGPEQRVLSTVRDRPMVISVRDVAPSVPLLDLTAIDPLTRSAFAPNFGPAIPSPVAEPFGVVRGPTATGPVNAVPEPDAWLMLIGGHAVLGWSLRRRRRLQPYRRTRKTAAELSQPQETTLTRPELWRSSKEVG